MVKVDYGSLPRKNPATHVPVKADSDQEIYDDVGEQDSVSKYETSLSTFSMKNFLLTIICRKIFYKEAG